MKRERASLVQQPEGLLMKVDGIPSLGSDSRRLSQTGSTETTLNLTFNVDFSIFLDGILIEVDGKTLYRSVSRRHSQTEST